MSPIQSKLKHNVIRSQTREVVWNVLSFMEKEAEQGSFTVPVSKELLLRWISLCEMLNQKGEDIFWRRERRRRGF